MKAKAILAVALILCVGFAFVAPMGTDDGATIVKAENVTFEGNAGTLMLKYTSDRSIEPIMTVKIVSTGEVIYQEHVKIKSTGGETETIPVNLAGKVNGTQILEISFEGADIKPVTVTVTVSPGIWGNWATYGVIIMVIILVAALVYFKSRTPKPKNTLTFEEIEAQKQAERAAPAAEKKKAASSGSTERQKYLASKKKKE